MLSAQNSDLQNHNKSESKMIPLWTVVFSNCLLKLSNI